MLDGEGSSTNEPLTIFNKGWIFKIEVIINWGQFGLQDANSPIIEELIFLHDFINLILMFIISLVIIIIILLYKYININLLRNQKIKFMWISISIIILIQITLWDFSIYESSFVLLPWGNIYADTNSPYDFINQILTKAEDMASSGQNPPIETFMATIKEDIGIDNGFKYLICRDIWWIKFHRGLSKAQILERFDQIFR